MRDLDYLGIMTSPSLTVAREYEISQTGQNQTDSKERESTVHIWCT